MKTYYILGAILLLLLFLGVQYLLWKKTYTQLPGFWQTGDFIVNIGLGASITMIYTGNSGGWLLGAIAIALTVMFRETFKNQLAHTPYLILKTAMYVISLALGLVVYYGSLA